MTDDKTIEDITDRLPPVDVRERRQKLPPSYFLLAPCVGIMVVSDVISTTFEFGENQKGWLDILGICVVLLLVSNWQRWRVDSSR
jgi:hypothetical protein